MLDATMQVEVHHGKSPHQLAAAAECTSHSHQVQCSLQPPAELGAPRAVGGSHCLHHPAQLLPPHHAGAVVPLPHVPLLAALQVTELPLSCPLYMLR